MPSTDPIHVNDQFLKQTVRDLNKPLINATSFIKNIWVEETEEILCLKNFCPYK